MVFAEGLNIPTGVTTGYGGVWVLNAPALLFLREKDGKEISREVVLTGFGRTDTHELPNSLTWMADRHGVGHSALMQVGSSCSGWGIIDGSAGIRRSAVTFPAQQCGLSGGSCVST